MLQKISLPDTEQLIPAGVRQWWQQQSERDQKAVMLLSLFLVLVMFYVLIWQPVVSSVQSRDNKQLRLESRSENVYLRKYDLMNQYGTTDVLPLAEWLKQRSKEYGIRVASQNKDRAGQILLTVTYSQQQKVSAFLQRFSLYADLVDVNVNQSRRELIIRYREKA
ncbi:type II secretion system protein GspM [Oceanospirillum sediminis]|uniref:Type II secretion system protein M n=1 Tax=Oceanospirillum sediminis TaxID=2760088 RepID=A0A839INJ9_9GAMM|nr:type II secretion system protein GspM [Oceanospirillum sediminis]MBB1485856.1 type II secretion system protein M [Oceanospirillum sediminis]